MCVKLSLQIVRGILDAAQRRQRSLEVLAASRAGGQHGTGPMCFTIRTARFGVAVTFLCLHYLSTRNGTLLVSVPLGVVTVT